MELWFCALAGTNAARHNALTGIGEPHRAEEENGQPNLQHRRLHLRSASQGSAPASAAQRFQLATKEDQECPNFEVQGDLRLPP
jgi:hypothetical protein